MKKKYNYLFILLLVGFNTLILSFGCSLNNSQYTILHDELHQPAKYYKVGSPYVIRGKKYYPKENFSYKKIGIASWYGGVDHGKPTANGEMFDENLMTAAHKTLQLPSIVKVTNLENGRSVIVRVNDRGPFIGNRIIDLSRRAAAILGFEDKGTARVKMEVLTEESYAIKAATLKEKPAPKKKKSGAQQSKLYIQIGSFAKKKQAHEFVKQQNFTKGIRLFPSQSEHGTFYRVVLGSFQDRQYANNLLKKLKRMGYKGAFIVNLTSEGK